MPLLDTAKDVAASIGVGGIIWVAVRQWLRRDKSDQIVDDNYQGIIAQLKSEVERLSNEVAHLSVVIGELRAELDVQHGQHVLLLAENLELQKRVHCRYSEECRINLAARAEDDDATG